MKNTVHTGIRSFCDARDGYGIAGFLLLVGSGTIFLPFTLPYAFLRWGTWALYGTSAKARLANLTPEALLSTPEVRVITEEAQWMGIRTSLC